MLLSACLVFICASEPVAALSHSPAWRPTRVPQPVLHAARSTPAKNDDEIPGLRLLVASQLLSAWGDRCWDFAAPFFLLSLRPNSLMPIASQGLVVGAAVVLSSPAIGAFVDRAPRLRAARGALFLQNGLVAVCALLAAFALPAGGVSQPGIAAWVTAALFSLGCAGASCASLANSLSVSKDWVVVLASESAAAGGAAAEDTKERLANPNPNPNPSPSPSPSPSPKPSPA